MAIFLALLSFTFAIALFVLERLSSETQRQRERYADALVAALRWQELPYRVIRRANSAAATEALVQLFHQLQDDLVFHEAWLRIEDPKVHRTYQILLNELRRQCAPHIQSAWLEQPVDAKEGMNLGRRYVVSVDGPLRDFTSSVRAQTTLLRSVRRIVKLD